MAVVVSLRACDRRGQGSCAVRGIGGSTDRVIADSGKSDTEGAPTTRGTRKRYRHIGWRGAIVGSLDGWLAAGKEDLVVAVEEDTRAAEALCVRA